MFLQLSIATVVVVCFFIPMFMNYANIHFVSKLTFLDGFLGNRCSTFRSGDLTTTEKAVDGIFGFGPGALSVISQLSTRGMTPKVFSHCLKGDDNGGGILVLGEILEPSIVYSPLVPSQYVLSSGLLSLFPFLSRWTIFPLILFQIDIMGKYKSSSFMQEIYLHYYQRLITRLVIMK